QFEQARRGLLAELADRPITPQAVVEQWHMAPLWPVEDIVQALEQLQFEPFRLFVRRFFDGTYLQAYFYGNLYRQEAQRLAALTEHYFTRAADRAEPQQQLQVFPFNRAAVDLQVQRNRQTIPAGVYLPTTTGLPSA